MVGPIVTNKAWLVNEFRETLLPVKQLKNTKRWDLMATRDDIEGGRGTKFYQDKNLVHQNLKFLFRSSRKRYLEKISTGTKKVRSNVRQIPKC